MEAAFDQHSYKLLAATHVDTSTAVINDVQGLAALCQKDGTLFVTDGVCSVAGEELRMAEWGVDVALTASQKAIGVPPGLALVMAGPRAIEAFRARKTPVAELLRRLGQLAAGDAGLRSAQYGLFRHPGGQPDLRPECEPRADPRRRHGSTLGAARSDSGGRARRASGPWGWGRCRSAPSAPRTR